MDELGGYYVKWNKSDRERQKLCDLTYMWNLKNQTHRNREQPGGCQWQGLEMGEMGKGGQNIQTSSYKINKFLECNVQHEKSN